MNTHNDLIGKSCKPCEGGTKPMTQDEIDHTLPSVKGWSFDNGEIVRTYHFKNYYQTMAFVNALAWVAHTEDHHPDIEVGYKTCKVRYSTHAIGGISENDFICAAKINVIADA